LNPGTAAGVAPRDREGGAHARAKEAAVLRLTRVMSSMS